MQVPRLHKEGLRSVDIRRLYTTPVALRERKCSASAAHCCITFVDRVVLDCTCVR
jgi:hypothetical protein